MWELAEFCFDFDHIFKKQKWEQYANKKKRVPSVQRMQSWLHVFRKMSDVSGWNSILVKTKMVWFVLWQWAMLLLSVLHEHEGLEAGQWESQHDGESVHKVSWNATATLMKFLATSYHLNAFWIEADFVPKMFKWNNLIFVCTHPLKMYFWTWLVWIASKPNQNKHVFD